MLIHVDTHVHTTLLDYMYMYIIIYMQLKSNTGLYALALESMT